MGSRAASVKRLLERCSRDEAFLISEALDAALGSQRRPQLAHVAELVRSGAVPAARAVVIDLMAEDPELYEPTELISAVTGLPGAEAVQGVPLLPGHPLACHQLLSSEQSMETQS